MGILRIIACLSVILFGFSPFCGSVAAQNLSIYKNQTVGERLRDRITRLDNTDTVTQLERDIAEHLWMLREFQQ